MMSSITPLAAGSAFPARVNVSSSVHAQVQQGRDEVMLEFFTDEVGRSEDALMEMSFFVPRDNDRYGGAGDNPACKVGGATHPPNSMLAIAEPSFLPLMTLPMPHPTSPRASALVCIYRRQCILV